MNGRVAKALRKQAYGADGSIRQRSYSEINVRKYKKEIADPCKTDSLLKQGFDIMKQMVKDTMKQFAVWQTSTLVTDPKRRLYKRLKKFYYARRKINA